MSLLERKSEIVVAAKKKSKGKTKSGAKGKAAKGKRKASSRAASKAGRSGSGQRDSRLLIGAGVIGLAAVAVAVYAQRVPEERNPARQHTTETPIEVVEPPPTPLAATIPEALQVRVVARYPHSREAFTQGLAWHEGNLYESTGLEGRSSLRRVTLATGEVAQRIDLDPDIFAEGLAVVGDRLFQITWHDGIAFVYDRETFEKQREYRYEGEGWGLCFDGEHLAMSDGSDEIVFRDTESFEIVRRVSVTKVGRPVRRLNELECAQGHIYANVWQRNEIVRIDPASGRVSATIRAQDLLTREERRDTDVLNGIAYLPDTERFLITGKLWPAAFEVVFEPR